MSLCGFSHLILISKLWRRNGYGPYTVTGQTVAPRGKEVCHSHVAWMCRFGHPQAGTQCDVAAVLLTTTGQCSQIMLFSCAWFPRSFPYNFTMASMLESFHSLLSFRSLLTLSLCGEVCPNHAMPLQNSHCHSVFWPTSFFFRGLVISWHHTLLICLVNISSTML